MVANQVNGQSGAVQPIGSALIVHGTVNAKSAQGITRTLQPNSPIFLHDKITTGSDGMISIVFGDAARTQLDLGRMSDMTIDEDVFPGDLPVDITEAAMEVEQIQQALLEGEFDPTQDLEATAAGPAAAGAASDGGGISSVRFFLTAEEVTPESGAETVGISYTFLDPRPPVLEPLLAPVTPALAAATPAAATPAPAVPEIPPPPFIPPPPPTLDVDRVVEEEAMNPDMQTLGHIWEIEGEDASTVDNWYFEVGSGGSWVTLNLLSEQSTWWSPSWIDLDGDPDQANLDPHIRLYHDDGSGGLGTEIDSNDWSWPLPWAGGADGSSSPADPYLSLFLPAGNYILVVGDSFLSSTSALNGINPDSGDIEQGPYQIRLTGNLAITTIPDDGYITSMPSLSDGNQDQNDGPEDLLQPDSAVITGNLGAGSWSIISTTGLPHLQSQGGDITYELKNPSAGVYVLEAWVRYDGMPEPTGPSIAAVDFEEIRGEDRLVFTLQVEADGNYTFTLLDQLDNTPPGTAQPGGIVDMSLLDPAGAEENIELMVFNEFGDPVGWINNLDFSQNLQVVVPFYGAVTFPAGSFTITTVDDIPVALNVCHASMIKVEEDGMQMDQVNEGNWYWDPDADDGNGAWITDPDLSDGNQQPYPSWVDGTADDEDWSDPWSTDSIARLFKVGADELPENREQEIFSEATFGITDNQEILDELPQLWSHGEEIQYKIVGDNTLVAYVPGQDEPSAEVSLTVAAAEVQAPDGNEERVVFTLTIHPDGGWRFDLDDQLDHVAGHGENWALISGAEGQDYIYGLDLSSILTATDYDLDTITGAAEGSFILRVQDDVPTLVCRANVNADIAESALSTGYWTSGQEWLPDSSEGYPQNDWTNPDETDADTASDSLNSTGSLMNLVSAGADEELKFSLIGNTDGLPDLYSKGEKLHYNVDVTAGILVATAGEFGHTVFTLEVHEDGSWSFDLDDQLNHVDDGQNDQNTALRTNEAGTEQTPYIDLSSMIQAVDYDGDAVTLHPGMFTITVEDDIPVIKCWASVGGYVEEDGMTRVFDSDDHDNSEGNPDGWFDNYGDDEAYSFGSQSLARLLLADGADEEVTFTFADESVVQSYMAAQGLTSQNEALQYSITGNVLEGSTNAGTVFSLTVYSNGSWYFDLDDQLNHTWDWGQNWTLQGENQPNWYIDFSGTVVAVDYDGDEASLHDGQFTMAIQDDIPKTEYSGETFYVSEYAGYDNIVGTYTLNLWGLPTNPDIVIESTNEEANMGANEHSIGAYDPGTKFFVIADGANQLPDDLSNMKIVWNGETWVPRVDGTTYDVPIYFMDSYLNPDGQDHFMDENGDPLSFIPAEGAEVHIEDLPNLGDADFDDAVLRVEVGPSVNEANLPDGTDPADEAGRTVSGNLNDGTGGLKISVGADEPGTLYVNANEITPYNNGFDYTDPDSSSPPMLVMDGNGDSITIFSQTGTLIVHDDGTWQYTLTDNTLVHPDNDPGGADHTDGDSDRGTGDQVQDVFDLQFHDFDGDYVFPQIVININDDGPVVEAPAQDAILVDEMGNTLVADLNINFGADGADPEIGVDITPFDAQGNLVTDGGFYDYNDLTVKWVENPDGSWTAFKSPNDCETDTFAIRSVTNQIFTPLFTVSPEMDGGVFTGNYEVEQHNAFNKGSMLSFEVTGNGGGTAVERTLDDVDQGVRATFTAFNPNNAPSQVDKVNWSNQGMGVTNEFVDAGRLPPIITQTEILVMQLTYLSGPQMGDPYGVSQLMIGIDHLDQNDPHDSTLEPEQAIITAYKLGDHATTYNLTVTGQSLGASDQADQQILLDPGWTFDKIEFTASTENSSDYRVTSIDGVDNQGKDYDFDFLAQITDGDGDETTTTFNVAFDADGNVQGDDGDEVISGSSGDDLIDGGGGDDIIFGNEGEDTLLGGTGDDTIDGGEGDDLIQGNEGNDILQGGSGNDTIYGNSGDDVITGDDGYDYIDGGSDNDSIEGGDDGDILLGNTGDDYLYGDGGGDILFGDGGYDQLIGGDGMDILFGGSENDTLVGDAVNFVGDDDGNSDPVADGDSDIIEDGDFDISYGDGGSNVFGDAEGGDLEIGPGPVEEDLDNLIPPPDVVV